MLNKHGHTVYIYIQKLKLQCLLLYCKGKISIANYYGVWKNASYSMQCVFTWYQLQKEDMQKDPYPLSSQE